MNETTKRFKRTTQEAFPPRVDTGMEAYPDHTWRTLGNGILWVLGVLCLLAIITMPAIWRWFQ